MPDRKHPYQTYHINMLKKWHPRPTPAPLAAHTLFIKAVREEEEPAEQYLPGPELEKQLDLDQ